MKAGTALLALVLLFAATADAQSRPDYSPDGLMRLFATESISAEAPRIVEHRVGAFDFSVPGTNFRFHYLPFLTPLSGTELDVTQSWPDPFALTRTQIATSRRAWRTQRTLNAEIRRIERSDRARIRVTTR